MLSWTPEDLDTASKVVRTTCVGDLEDSGLRLINRLRGDYQVLLMSQDADFETIKDRLVELHKFGILNLSLNPLDWTLADLKQKCEALKAKQRSVTAQLRESKKRCRKAQSAAKTNYDRATQAEFERDECKRLLALARAQLAAFRITHPDWRPPDDILLMKGDVRDVGLMRDAADIFESIEHETGETELLQKQLEIDPSGML